MPDNNPPADPPVRITDKREQKRAEAEAARIEREAAAAASKEAHPSSGGQDEVEGIAPELEPGEETVDEALARIDRIQILKEKWATAEGLTEEEGHELLNLQAQQQEADQAGGVAHEALTAFLVIVGHDGTAQATHDVNINLSIDREATVDDMYHGVCIVKRDIDASITSRQVVFGLNVSAQAMQEKAAAIQQASMMQGRPPGRRRK